MKNMQNFDRNIQTRKALAHISIKANKQISVLYMNTMCKW